MATNLKVGNATATAQLICDKFQSARVICSSAKVAASQTDFQHVS